jgi:L,D-transpeptidase ErfK/SrfK
MQRMLHGACQAPTNAAPGMQWIPPREHAMQNGTPFSGKVAFVYALAVSLSAIALCGGAPREDRQVMVGAEGAHAAVAGESWVTIGARAGIAPAVLAARNGRKLGTPLMPGDAIVIDNRHLLPDRAGRGDGLLVNVPQRLVFLFADGRLQAHYPVAVGRSDWPTPLGEFVVVRKEEDPTWDVPLSIQQEMRRAGKRVITAMPPGPANPLGRYWMGLSLGSIGMHGTVAPLSIYSYATHGCIRLHPDDVGALFDQVREGEPGRIVYEPVLVAHDGTDVFLEVHPDPYGRAPDRLRRAHELLEKAGLGEAVDREEVARVVRAAEGLAMPVTRVER